MTNKGKALGEGSGAGKKRKLVKVEEATRMRGVITTPTIALGQHTGPSADHISQSTNNTRCNDTNYLTNFT